MSLELSKYIHTSPYLELSSTTPSTFTGCYPTCTPPTLGAPEQLQPPSVPVTTQQPKSPESPGLPFTGADVVSLSFIGTAAIIGGAILTYRRSSNKLRS